MFCACSTASGGRSGRELRGRPRGLRQAGGGDRRPGELHGRRRRGHGIVRGRADEEARGARVQRRRGAQAQEGQGEARRGEERPAGRRARGAQGGVREGLLRAEVAGRLGRGGAPALRRAQAGRRDVHVLRGLREVDAHDGPERPEGAVQGPRAAEGPHAAARAREEGGRRARGERAGLAAVRRGGLEGGPQPGRVPRRAHPRAAGGERARAARRRGLRRHDRRRPGRGRRRQPRQAEGRGGVLDDVRRLPIPASSGKTDRHRLNRGGNRQANWAPYEIAIKRMAYDERTRRYVARRTSRGSPGGRRSAA